MARSLTTRVRDTPEIAEQLERIRQAQMRAQAAAARLRAGRPPGLAGTYSSAVSPYEDDKPEPRVPRAAGGAVPGVGLSVARRYTQP